MTSRPDSGTRSRQRRGPGAGVPEDLLRESLEAVIGWRPGAVPADLPGDPLDALVALVAQTLEPAGSVGPDLPRDAVRLVVRTLLDRLVAKAPGRSVEVRIPPFAAVQCVAGPRHTRGTPPNVVEADPATWVRLATGVTAWAEAVADGSVRASGARADLAPYLPLTAAPEPTDDLLTS